MRFKVLKNGLEFDSLQKNADVISALCSIHNFLLLNEHLNGGSDHV